MRHASSVKDKKVRKSEGQTGAGGSLVRDRYIDEEGKSDGEKKRERRERERERENDTY